MKFKQVKESLRYILFLKEPYFVTFKFPKCLQIMANQSSSAVTGYNSVTWRSYFLFREDHKVSGAGKSQRQRSPA